MSDELQALCFFAGANSIFVGDTLLTAANPGDDRDRSLLHRLGISPRTHGCRQMMPKRLARYETTLEQLERKGRRRKLSARNGKDFTSNDYLGLAESPRLRVSVISALDRGVPVGAGGSRLLLVGAQKIDNMIHLPCEIAGPVSLTLFLAPEYRRASVSGLTIKALPAGQEVYVEEFRQ